MCFDFFAAHGLHRSLLSDLKLSADFPVQKIRAISETRKSSQRREQDIVNRSAPEQHPWGAAVSSCLLINSSFSATSSECQNDFVSACLAVTSLRVRTLFPHVFTSEVALESIFTASPVVDEKCQVRLREIIMFFLRFRKQNQNCNGPS